MPDSIFAKKASRREFLRNTAVTAIAGGVLCACSIDKSDAQTLAATDANLGASMPAAPSPSPADAAEAMDRMQLQQSGHVGLPLPHPSARGIGPRDVRDGNRPNRKVRSK
jgi:hypothetical protein